MQKKDNSSKKRLIIAVIAIATILIAFTAVLYVLMWIDTARPPDVYVDLIQESEKTYKLLIKATANPLTIVVVTTNGIIKQVTSNNALGIRIVSEIGTPSVGIFLTQFPISSVSRYEVLVTVESVGKPHYNITVTNPSGTWSGQA